MEVLPNPSKNTVSLAIGRLFDLLFQVCIDDSWDGLKEKAVVAGGFIGFSKQWTDLKTKWMRRLKQGGLKYFRSTEYYSLTGEFARYRDPIKYPKPKGSDAARSLREDLFRAVENSQIMGVGVVIPLDVYRDVRASEPGAAERFSEDPFEAALQSLLEECVKFSRAKLESTKLAFVCDDSNESARIERSYSIFRQNNPDFAQITGSLVHRDDKKFVPLQCADMSAHTCREFYMNYLSDHTAKPRFNAVRYRIQAWTRQNMLDEMKLNRLRHIGL